MPSPQMRGFPKPSVNSQEFGGRNKVFMPGDVKTLNTKGFGEGMPIWKRLAVIIRAYPGLEVFEVMKGFDAYDRKFFERTQFYRAIENLVGKAWIELAMTSEEFDELCKPYLTKVAAQGGPPPMIQYKRFALDLQRYADQVLTDDDITKAQELRGYVNPGDLVRNDGFFEARPDEKGKDMSPDGRRLKKHQSAKALATGIWEYEVGYAPRMHITCRLPEPWLRACMRSPCHAAHSHRRCACSLRMPPRRTGTRATTARPARPAQRRAWVGVPAPRR